MTAQGFVPDDPDEWAKTNQAPAAAWQPDDPEEWAKGQGDQNAHLLKSSVKVAPTESDFEKNMAFHKAKREASPVYQSVIEKPENEHPFHRLARITTPTMLNAVDAAKSLVEHFDPKLEKSRFFAQKAMDALAAGTYSQAGTLLQAAKMAKGEASFSDLIHKGILSGPEVLAGVGPGKDSRTFNSDVLDEMGVKNPWLKYGGGFALDIAANPANFIKGVGLLPLGKAAKMYTEAMQEARVMGTAAPNWEEMAKNGNRTARLIVKTLAKEGGEDALNFGTTTAEQVEKGHAGFGGLQIPGMKRINMTRLRFQMSEDAWAKLAEESPDLAGKIKPGEPIPKDVMKQLLKVKGDEAFKDISLHPSTTRKSFPIPVPDIHNPMWEMQGLPKGASVPLAKALTATNRYLREFNPEYLKPEASALQNAYGKARKVSSDFMEAMDKTFHRYPKPVMEGKLADPRIFDDTVMITRMALNQKGDLTRETLDALYDLQTRVGGDKNVVLKMARSLKLDKSAPDTYRAIETALSHRVPNADFQGVRSSLEDATRTITPNRDLPNEWELRNFGTNDPAKIRQQIDDAVAVQRGEWGNDKRQAVAEALASGEVGKEEAQAALAAIDAQGASIARDAEDKLRAVDNLERNLQRHRDELFSLRAAERQAAYSGTPEQIDRFGKMAGETEQSLGPNGWGETYRKVFGKDINEVLPEATGQPRMAFPSASQRLRAAQDDVARIQESLRSAAEEQRALAAAMEAAPSPSNEALVRLERANQRSAELQVQLQQRVKMISDLEDRVRNEGDTDAMIQKVQAALDKQHEVDTADEIAQLEKHPAMARPSTTLKSVRQERARLLQERPAAFRDESFAPEGETVLEHLKARYGDDPEYYKAMLEQRAAAHDRAEFRKSAARAEREGAKGLREAVKVAEPAAPEKPVLAAPAWRIKTPEAPAVTAAEPLPYATDPAEIGGKAWFHGTGSEIKVIDATMTNPEGLVGQGFYLTDEPQKAIGYMKARGRRTGIQNLYQVKVPASIHVLDLEKPPDPRFMEVVRNVWSKAFPDGSDIVDAVEAAAKQEGATGVDVYRALTEAVAEHSGMNEIPKSEYSEIFGEMNSQLSAKGIDALTHEGGKVTGTSRHQVLVLLDPSDTANLGRQIDYSLSKADPEMYKPQVPREAIPASEEIVTAPGKTWHDFTLHPPDIQARIEAGQGVETGFVDATGKFFTREEVAQQGLKMGKPGVSSEAMLKVNSATPEQNPHWWHAGYTRESRAKAFDDLPDDADVWVFTATDDETANKFLKEGVRVGGKPSNLARERFEAGEEAHFAPGRGLSPHLYVGSDPLNVDGYGRRILAVKVKKGSIKVSPEQATLGNKSPGDAISLSDAVVDADIPKDNIIDTKIKENGVTAQQFMSKAFAVERREVPPNRPAIGKPRVPLKGSGLPVPAPKPVASAVDLSSFGMNNPPDIRAFIANREAGGSQLGLAMTGAQDLRGAIPEPGSTGMHEYQAWLSKTLENPTVAEDISEEVARDLVRLSGQGWASRRAMRDMVDSWIHTEDGRQKIVKFMAEYFPHVKDVTAAYSSPLAVVLGGPPKGALGRPGFATARKFRDTFDDIQQAAKLTTGKDLLVEDVATTLFNRAADSIHFQVHNDMLNRMLSSMGLSGKEIQAALLAEGIRDIPNARAAANIVNAHYWMRKMGYPNEAIAKVEKLNKKLIDMGVWNMTGNPADPTAAEGVMNRLAAIARTGDFREAKGITFDETGKAFSDLPDGIKKRLMRAVGVTDDAALIDPAQHVPGTSLKDAAAKIIRDVNQTVKERDVLAPRLKLFMTKGDLAQLADVPDFVNVMSIAKSLRESDMKDVGTTLVNLDPATIPNFKQLDQFGVNYYLLPEQLAQHINGGVKTFMDDSGPRGLISRWAHGATNIWKQSVTTIFPEFHLRNIMTNMYQLHVYAGVDDPALFWQARKIQLGLPGAFDRGDGSILTNAEVLRLAQKYGVAGHGYFGEDVKAILDPRKNAHISRAKGVVGAPLSVGRDVGRFWEENARVGGFLHFLREGYSPYSASMLVKKFLFDYSELSPTERNTFRLFIPFYAWMRKNIPLQLGEIIRNPATASVSRDIQHAVSGLVNGQDLTPEQFDNLPSWLKPMLPILYRNRHDKPKITAIAGKVSPMSDPMQLGQDIGERGLLGGVGSYLWGGSNPVLKEGTKQAFSVDVESGRKLFENPIHKVPLHLPFGLAGPVGRTLQLPVGKGLVMIPERAGSILQNLRGVSFMNSTMKDAAEDTTAAQNVETVLKNLAGLRSYDVDLQKNYQMEGRNQKKAIEEEAPFTRDGEINFKSPLIREIMKRAKDASKGVPPMTPEERKAFNERLRKAQEKFQQQRTQRP